jgi:uncharacterized membrane protein YidH (DUF202 family)
MRLWPGLIIPPLAFLTLLVVNYAIEPWACEYQVRWPLHLASAVTFALVLGVAALAWRDWKRVEFARRSEGARDVPRVQFLSAMALMLTGLMALAVVALWTTILIMPPCLR